MFLCSGWVTWILLQPRIDSHAGILELEQSAHYYI